MQTITVERTFAAAPAAVFDWISNAHNYTRIPLVLSERLGTRGAEAPYGTGAVREIVWAAGFFHERITAYDAPHSFDYHTFRSFPPAEHRGGRVTCTAVPEGTHLHWTSTYTLRFPVIAPLLTRRVATPLLTYAFERILDAAQADLG